MGRRRQDPPDFQAILADAFERGVCPHCGAGVERHAYGERFCDGVCARRFSDRQRYWATVDEQREKSLARYYATRPEPQVRHCSECGRELEGRQRVACGSSSCREVRLKRTNPEAHAKREAGKVERRRQARRRAREKPAPSPAT
jgi:hypothetical protein